jgi:hypothetical protein
MLSQRASGFQIGVITMKEYTNRKQLLFFELLDLKKIGSIQINFSQAFYAHYQIAPEYMALYAPAGITTPQNNAHILIY